RGLIPLLEGRVIVRARNKRPDLRFPLPKRFAPRIQGQRVTAIRRRGKFLLIVLEQGEVLIVHLGMSGRLSVYPKPGKAPPEESHDHVIFETDEGTVIRFNDPRRFGFMDLVPANGLAAYPMLARLGPEPLEDSFDGPALAARLKGKAPIKNALSNQAVVAGLGNIYVSECLFRAGLSPKRRTSTVKGERADRLATAIRDVLTAAIKAGGSTLRDHRQPSGELGYFQHNFAVYGRTGERCPGCACDAKLTGGIRQIVQAGRTTFYCATRQR
ncbi:MAG: bifunctional DNA-formamidopyrimidine glycosylase/DNA-(apurinic or apyrimidinic site) lyase, partial [Alphaproteobacteria bacterium]|nr:bifunctional DNA-formamidopyrimidine glycosylase/DNA-(apurinic or apyrimidinic site) lyase [Alphaproteobacteria bacterium]